VSIVQYETPPPLPASQPGEELAPGPAGDVARLRAAAEYAGHIAETEFVPDPLRSRPAAVAAAILAGGEVGLTPMAALRSISVIKGRPTLSAEAQRGLIMAAGHEIWFDESTVTRAIACGRRAGTDRVGRITWTLDDAKRAGIAGQNQYRNYPAEMLRARASAALARAMFADVTLGIPAAEELDDVDNGVPPPTGDQPTPPPDQPAPPASTRTRKRAPTKRAQAAPPERAPLPPTPPPDRQEQPSAEPLATDARKRQIFALMRDAGMPTGDEHRDERLGYASRIAGRTITSSNELTMSEAQRILDDLAEVKALPAAERAVRLRGAPEEPSDPSSGEANASDARTAAVARLAQLFDEKQIGDDGERASYAGCVVGHEARHTDDLTDDELSAVIAHLEQYDKDDPQSWPFPEGF
jgi:hypothetical protein